MGIARLLSQKSPTVKSRGAAANSLRKLILFDLAGRLDLLTCYQCGNPIETVREFSIEHKQPWEGAENEEAVFFDFDNIAFSHLGCNSGACRRQRLGLSTRERHKINSRKFRATRDEAWKDRRRQSRRKPI